MITRSYHNNDHHNLFINLTLPLPCTDTQNAKCFSDPVYGMAEANGFMRQVHGMGAPTFAANEGFGYATGAGSGYGLAGPVGNVGFGPYSVYGGYYNGYVPNVPPPPMQPYPQVISLLLL